MLSLRHIRKSVVLIHVSFLLMIVGGICTALFSIHGVLHLYPGEYADSFIAEDGRIERLPERVKLVSFEIDRYPSTDIHKDYRTTLLTATGDTMRISMNSIGRLPHDYRLYQSSYDEYGGTVLAVTHDPSGSALVYLGFLLFTAAGVMEIWRGLKHRHTAWPTLYAIIVCVISIGVCLVFMNPMRIGVLPVLATWWMPVHVGFCAAGYVVLASTLPIAVAIMSMAHRRMEFATAAIRLLWPGVFLLGIGIVIGAMWANVSWGRYWGWDPKETWALITFIAYSIPIHRFSGLPQRPKGLAIYLVIASLTIAMTYWGVNYLPSLHAYN